MYFEIAEYQGSVYSRLVRENDTTVYADTVLETVYVEDFNSLKEAEREADRLVETLQKEILEEY